MFLRRSLILRNFCNVVAKEPEVPKDPLLKRIRGHMKEYLATLVHDYTSTAKEAGEKIRTRPFASALLATLLGGTCALIATCPDETHYSDSLTRAVNDLCPVGDLVRNPHSTRHVTSQLSDYTLGHLRFLGLGPVCFVWRSDHPRRSGVYACICPYTQADLFTWHRRVVDVGLAGRWWGLERQMRDYDVNPEEWDGLTDDAMPRQRTATLL